jgi:hypothetical protein
MEARKPNSPFDIMRRALALTLLYVDNLHAFGWGKDDEERFAGEFQREVGITPDEFMALQGYAKAEARMSEEEWKEHWNRRATQMAQRPQTARCNCGLCEGRRRHPHGAPNIWMGKQAAAVAFGAPVNQVRNQPIPRPERLRPNPETHHRSCALRRGGSCTC